MDNHYLVISRFSTILTMIRGRGAIRAGLGPLNGEMPSFFIKVYREVIATSIAMRNKPAMMEDFPYKGGGHGSRHNWITLR